MVRLTLIARLTDGLPLAEGLESDKGSDIGHYKQQAKVVGQTALLLRNSFQYSISSHAEVLAWSNLSAQLSTAWKTPSRSEEVQG